MLVIGETFGSQTRFTNVQKTTKRSTIWVWRFRIGRQLLGFSAKKCGNLRVLTPPQCLKAQEIAGIINHHWPWGWWHWMGVPLDSPWNLQHFWGYGTVKMHWPSMSWHLPCISQWLKKSFTNTNTQFKNVYRIMINEEFSDWIQIQTHRWIFKTHQILFSKKTRHNQKTRFFPNAAETPFLKATSSSGRTGGSYKWCGPAMERFKPQREICENNTFETSETCLWKHNWVVLSNIFYFHPYLGKWFDFD